MSPTDPGPYASINYPSKMKFNFEIDTPNACIDCKFHTIDKADRYDGWFARCLIDRDLKMAVKDSLERRHEKCPGKIDDRRNT